jgi:hypothetical protein
MHSAFQSLLIVLTASLSVAACAAGAPLEEDLTLETPPAPQGESKWKKAAAAATQTTNEPDTGAIPPGDLLPPGELDPTGPDGATSTPTTQEQDAGAPPPVTAGPDAQVPSTTPPSAPSASPTPTPSSSALPPTTIDAGSFLNSVDRCPGEGVSLSIAHPSASVSATTTSLRDDSSSTNCVAAAGGHDAAYRFTAPGNGHVILTLAPNGYSGSLYVREGTCAGSEVACASGPVLNVPVTVDVPVVAGGVYFVFADQQYGLTQGSFVLTLNYEGK